MGASAVAHGSTGAGNDQVRFDVAFRVLAPELQIITPIREANLQRADSIAYLEARGLPVPARASAYSINRGLWGTTYGGGWTHDTWAGPPDELFEPPAAVPAPREIVIGWEQGVPVSIDGVAIDGPTLVDQLGDLCAEYGAGRGIHVGETALGIKGRIGFEAGAALLLIQAHRELEKLVLTKWQVFWKDSLGSSTATGCTRGSTSTRRCGTSRPCSPARSSGSPATRGCGCRTAARRSPGREARSR
jgi:argininosuccinate synthase